MKHLTEEEVRLEDERREKLLEQFQTTEREIIEKLVGWNTSRAKRLLKSIIERLNQLSTVTN